MLLYRKDQNKYQVNSIHGTSNPKNFQVNFSAFHSMYDVETPLCSARCKNKVAKIVNFTQLLQAEVNILCYYNFQGTGSVLSGKKGQKEKQSGKKKHHTFGNNFFCQIPRQRNTRNDFQSVTRGLQQTAFLPVLPRKISSLTM